MEESIENAINEFYKLKNKYETEISKNKHKIMNNPLFSSKEKRSQFLRLKPKCINCLRPGGTIFSIKYYPDSKDQNEHRELIAKCGIISDPCNLNINIQIGKYTSLIDNLKEVEDEIKETKKSVIDDKNKLLFGFITTETALENFDTNKDFISDLSSLLEVYLNSYNDLVDNSEKRTELKESIELSYNFINQIKEAIVHFNETNNHQFVRDAVNIYINNLKPILSKIASLKYKENTVFYNNDTNTYHLIQNKYRIKDFELTSFNNKVVKFEVGYVKNAPKKKGFIIESDSTTEATFEESVPEEELEAVPIYENDNVSWSNDIYQSVWNRMPTKLKDVLKSDREWMQEFMNKCVEARKNKTNCIFIAPQNLIIPPNKLSDGKYDFGNEYYNILFNKFSPSYQDTLLTLFSTKNGEKDYSMFLDTINNQLAKSLDFERGYF